jgi:hypothetical protein
MIGRPDKSEAAPYYFAYIDRLTGDDPLSALENQAENSMQSFSGISEEVSLRRYAPGKWSIRQTLNHITDTERLFAFRALWFARGLDAPLPGYDQNIAVGNGGADEVLWSAHVEEFRRVRLSTISLFRNLPLEAWTRTGVADGNSFTVRALAFIIAGHLAHHVAVLGERYLLADSIQV